MVNKIVLIILMVFCFRYSYCQDTTKIEPQPKPRTDTTVAPKPVTPKPPVPKPIPPKPKPAPPKAAPAKQVVNTHKGKDTVKATTKVATDTGQKINKPVLPLKPADTPGSPGRHKPTGPPEKQVTITNTEVPVWLIICVAALALTAAFLFFKNRKMAMENNKRQAIIDNHAVNLNKLRDFLLAQGILNAEAHKEIKNINGIIEYLTDRYIAEEDRARQLGDELMLLRNKQSVAPVIAGNLPITFIKTEINVSAGPRKNADGQDTEMGEDIAGAISQPGKTYFWLLDGTSDNVVIKGQDISQGDSPYEESHIFSSRVLAQNIGYFIQQNINRYGAENIPLNELVYNAGKHVAGEWEKRINGEPQAKKDSIFQAIKKGFKPLCSTTVIAGCLFDDGRLQALRTGDSKVFPFKQSNEGLYLDKEFKLTADPTKESDRLAFRLDFNEAGNAFVIKQNQPKFLIQSADEIQSVFVFSDGIGRVTEAQLASGNPGIVEMIRQNISLIPQKTHDDKTLIILERITTG